MGLLDDAIREHLELKRRRGADAGEVSREESEALGPVRRSPDGTPDLTSIPAPPALAEPPSAAPPPVAYEPPPPAEEPAGDDILEETPEFLEETPDHDRLWFEQRPPRDFDFDK